MFTQEENHFFFFYNPDKIFNVKLSILLDNTSMKLLLDYIWILKKKIMTKIVKKAIIKWSLLNYTLLSAYPAYNEPQNLPQTFFFT